MFNLSFENDRQTEQIYRVATFEGSREFTKPRRGRRGQRRVKNKFMFIYESRDTLNSFALFSTVKTIAKLNSEPKDKFEIKILKNSRRGSRSPDHPRFGHFTLLTCRGRKEMYQEL